MDNSLSKNELIAKTQSLAIINAIADTLYRYLDFKTVAEKAVEAVVEYIPVSSVAMFTVKDDMLELATGYGFSEDVLAVGSQLPVQGSLTGLTIQRGEIVLSEDIQADESIDKDVQQALLAQGLRGIISIPLLFQNQVLGAMNLIYENAHHLTRQERETLLSVGKTIGLAIANARHVEMLEAEVQERRRIEAELLRYQNELEDIVRKRTEDLEAYARTVAHNLKDPLTVMTSYADFMRVAYDRISDEERQEYIEVIHQTGHKMGRIIDELLLLAEVRRADELTIMPLNMQAIIDEVLKRLDNHIRASDAVVTLPETWPRVTGYAPWVEEIWANYLSNALKYGGEPPHITLGAEPQPDESVRFYVRDNGPGISAEQQKRLFTPFARLNKAGKEKGHGLGLSIVRRIAEKLDGEAGVESQAGQGSTFFFTLKP